MRPDHTGRLHIASAAIRFQVIFGDLDTHAGIEAREDLPSGVPRWRFWKAAASALAARAAANTRDSLIVSITNPWMSRFEKYADTEVEAGRYLSTGNHPYL